MVAWRFRLFCSALLIGCAAVRAAGQERRGPFDTVEWLTADSAAVVAGTVAAFRLERDSLGREGWEEITVRVTHSLKGGHAGTVTIVKPRFAGPQAEEMKGSGAEYLFFLAVGDGSVKYLDPHYLQGRLHLREPDWDMICLREPIVRRLYSCTFVRLERARDVIEAARAPPPTSWPAKYLPATRSAGPKMMVAPSNSAVSNELGWLQLRVPDDYRWRVARVKLLLKERGWWANLWQRDGSLNAQWAELQCPEAAAVLAEAARSDPHRQSSRSPGWNRSIRQFRIAVFPGRDSARRVLEAWGYPAPGGVSVPAHPRSPPGFLASSAGILAVMTLAFVLWGRRSGVFRRLLNATTAVLVVVAVMSLWMWQRSRWHYDDLIFATPAAQYELSSCYGKLQYLRVLDRPEPHGPVAYSASLSRREEVPDHVGHLFGQKRVGRWGFESHAGLTPADQSHYGQTLLATVRLQPARPHPLPTMANAYAFRMVRIPWWWVAAAAGMFPAVRGLAIVVARIRAARRRRRINLCPKCGYDVRATPGRCPECGWGWAS
jgi:hypothetical protein